MTHWPVLYPFILSVCPCFLCEVPQYFSKPNGFCAQKCFGSTVLVYLHKVEHCICLQTGKHYVHSL